MRSPVRITTALLSIALALGVTATVPEVAATADVSDFEFDVFHAQIDLGIDADGRTTAAVTETIVAVFPDFDQNRGIVRAIPLRDQGYDLGVEIVAVSDANGAPVAWERDDEDGFAVLALGTDEFVQGRTTYVIEYELHDVIRTFADSGGDEFTWDINGDGWAQPFSTVTAEVIVAPELADSLAGEFTCYAGFEEISEPCSIERAESTTATTFTAAAGPLAPFRTLTVSIGFEGGTAAQPDRAQDSWVVTIVPWVLLGIAVALLVIAIVARSTTWRDPARRRAIIAEFAPPEPRDLLLDGDVLGRPAPVFAAVVIDLAVRGVVRIVDLDATADPDERYGIELVDPAGATPVEAGILTALFESPLTPGDVVRPAEIAASAGAAVHTRLAAAPAASIMNGLRQRASGRWATVLRVASLVVAIAGVAPFVWMIGHDLELVWVVLNGLLVAGATILIWVITSPPTLLTQAGADRRDHLLGMREYLTVAEQDRFRMLQSPGGATRVARVLGVDAAATGADGAIDRAEIVKLNERLLPWAVLWGVEDEWSKALIASAAAAGVASSAVVMGLTNPGVFTWASSSASRMTPPAASGGSSWSSSGGSSFSSSSFGGGFAGGGGGGGGGGGR